MSAGLILIAADPADHIRGSSARWGHLTIGYSDANELFHAVGFSDEEGPAQVDPVLGYVKINFRGVWCRASPGLHSLHTLLADTGAQLSAKVFRRQLGIEERLLAYQGAMIVVTHCPQGAPEWAGWLMASDEAGPMELEVMQPPATDPLRLLGPNWPLNDLAGEVVIVGVGSIGSAAALALAMYGVRKITLVDDDRMLWHNLVRHQATRHAVGRYKVDAVRDAIRLRWPAADILALRLNVISNANLMRPLFRRCELVLCAADGVTPRRVVSHLARRAEKTAILACVLMDGTFGEIIRLRPWPGSGCLLCQRAYLVSAGSMDPEPALDSGYETGTAHRPMTAVGSDLALIGQYAAKMAVATLLESAGHYSQRIEPDWAVIGLRADLSMPEPFNLHPGEVRWLPRVEPLSDCPTCGAG